VGPVEPHPQTPRLDLIAVAHPDLANDAARRVLHLLDVAVDHHRASGEDGTGEVGSGCPTSQPEHQQEHNAKPDDQLGANVIAYHAADGCHASSFLPQSAK